MDFDGPGDFGPGGFGWGLQLAWRLTTTLAGFVVVLVLIGLTILLVRYLLVATKAAQLYVAAHTDTPPSASEPPPAVADPTPSTPPASAAAKPAPRTRAPKTPPAAG